MDVTICVATFGDPTWQTLARTRAVPSAEAQGVPVVHVHGRTLHAARNAAVEQAQTEWVIHLDADDELTAGYVQRAVDRLPRQGTGPWRSATRYADDVRRLRDVPIDDGVVRFSRVHAADG